jgi:hypothetical protein
MGIIHRSVLCFGIVTVLGLAIPGAQRRDPVEADVALWSAEVQRHVPGTADDPARALAQWSWKRLHSILERFFTNRRVPNTTLLLRATVAYGDISLFVPRDQRPVYPGLYTGNDRVTLANDGRPVGDAQRDTHLRVAHEIVRRVVRFSGVTEEEKKFAAAWYVALAASLAGANDLAGLKDHLAEAREQFPRNAEIYFLSGCWAESVASPAVQAALPTPDEKRPSQMKLRDLHTQDVLARSTNLALARDLYRHALEIDPGHHEARVRLGRLLTLDGETTQALSLLHAKAPSVDPVLEYYRRLFLGRAYERTNELALARTSYQAASQTFSRAQSPWLALSALAALEGDPEASRASFEAAIDRTDGRDDPWWLYYACNGRDADGIYADFIQHAKRLTAGDPLGVRPE